MTQAPPPPGDPVDGDPLLRVLRRRHPDVDLVVLPPVATPPPGEPHLGPDEADAAAASARTALEELVAAVAEEPAAHSAGWLRVDRSVRWCRELACSWPRDDDRAAVELLRRLGDALLAEGWAAGPVAPAEVPTLLARRGGLTVRARVHSPGCRPGVSVRLRTEPVALTDAGRDHVRRQVASR